MNDQRKIKQFDIKWDPIKIDSISTKYINDITKHQVKFYSIYSPDEYSFN